MKDGEDLSTNRNSTEYCPKMAIDDRGQQQISLFNKFCFSFVSMQSEIIKNWFKKRVIFSYN